MIPDFDESGNLPPGEYRTTVDEIIQRFGSKSLRRKDLTGNLKAFIGFIGEHTQRIYIDGSYTTGKLSPGDIDLLIIMPSHFDANSDVASRLAGWQMQKGTKKLHIFVFREGSDDLRIRSLLNDFSHDHASGAPRGIIYIEGKK